MDGYYLSSDIPEIFKAADRAIAKENPQPKYVDMTRTEPKKGLEINSNPRVLGPIKMTQDFYDKAVEKRDHKRFKEVKRMRVEMIQLIAEKDMLRSKLAELDPGRKKDSKKIAAINVRLEKVINRIQLLETESGTNAKELDHGTKPARVIGNIKRKVKKTVKKIKKFFKRNEELIVGMASIIMPFVCVVVLKSCC